MSTIAPPRPPARPRRVHDVDEQAAIDWANQHRRRLHLSPLTRLPRGRRDHGSQCPLARATGLCIGSTDWWVPGRADTGGLMPYGVVEFVRRFDQGDPRLAHLDLDSKDTP